LNVGLVKKAVDQKETDFKALNEGVSLCKSGETLKGIKQLLLGNALEEACHYGAEFISQALKSSKAESFLWSF
jgi:hypothetical protein